MKMIHRLFCAVAVLLGIFSQSASGVSATIKANDDAVSITARALPITLDHLTDNDTSSGSIFIFNASQPSTGTVQLKPNNVIVYTPSNKFSGTDTFTYSISTSANGTGAISTASVTIRNPYIIGRGVYSTEIAGPTPAHETSGYLQITTTSKATFTASLRYGGQIFSIKNTFGPTGRYIAVINRAGSLTDLQLDLQFAFTGTPRVDCILTMGAQATPFTAAHSPWSRANKPLRAGRYTMILRPPGLNYATPQGTGYAYLRIGSTGSVSVLGRTGESRGFTSGTILKSNDTFPLYSPLFRGTGSLFGTVTLTPVNPTKTTLAANLTWFKPKNANDAFFPRGFNLTVPVIGSLYLEPLAQKTILPVATFKSFNAKFKAEAGNLRTARTELALLGKRPDAGLYEMSFDNAKRFAAKLIISPRTGLFRGSFYDTTTRDNHRINGVFVQSENAAYGIWNTHTRTGRVELVPDPVGT